MALDHIQVPIPRLRQRMGGIALFLILATVIVFSAVELSEQVYLLKWMRQHDTGSKEGFMIQFNHRHVHLVSWLPTLLYRGPHHQLAVAACIVNFVASVLVMGLFVVSCRVPKNFGQHWILISIFIPTITLLTTALLYNFIEHGNVGHLNTYALYTDTHEPDNVLEPRSRAYGANWLDFETWSCDLLTTPLGYRWPWGINCRKSQLGRWLLLPTWFAVVFATLVSWLAFRGLPAWRAKKEEEEYVVEGGEGRVRLP